MTNNQLTKEWLQNRIADMESTRDDIPFGFDESGNNELAAFKLALAAMNNEPVAFTEKHEISNMHATGLYLRAWPADRARNSVEGYTIPLYTTPQPISLVNSEPVAYIFKHPAGRLFWALTDESNKGQNDVMPVYASPQPSPVVPDDVLEALQKVARIRLDLNDFDGDHRGLSFCLSDAEETLIDVVNRRAAMLQESKKSAGAEATCRSNENAQVLNTIKAPPALDSLPKTGEVQNTDSPVIPDGYVMVPDDLKEAAADLLATLDDYPEQLVPINRDSSVVRALRAAMLAAAPQSPGSEPATVPGKWIPVSEQMPEVGDIVLTAMGGVVNVGETECSAANCRFFTSVISGRELPATHWMQLPAAPQEVKGE